MEHRHKLIPFQGIAYLTLFPSLPPLSAYSMLIPLSHGSQVPVPCKNLTLTHMMANGGATREIVLQLQGF